MWLFMKQGFFSVVQDKADPSYLFVRARDREHLHRFGAKDADIVIIPGSDYQYRIRMHKTTFGVMVAQLINKIDYKAFKSSIDDDARYTQALFDIWRIMYNKYYDEYEKVGG